MNDTTRMVLYFLVGVIAIRLLGKLLVCSAVAVNHYRGGKGRF